MLTVVFEEGWLNSVCTESEMTFFMLHWLPTNQSSEYTNLNIHGNDNNYLEINSVATISRDLPYDYIDISDENCRPEDKVTTSGNGDYASSDIVGSQCNMKNVISDSVVTRGSKIAYASVDFTSDALNLFTPVSVGSRITYAVAIS
jgi:hypothetical protein